MGFLQEFKAFAMRGNVVDMAIGVIIGGAFSPIVTSLVSDIMMPVIGMATGGVSFSDKKLELQAATVATSTTPAVPAVTMNYGKLIDVTINFIIVAFCLFMLIKAMNAAKKKEAVAPPPPPPGPTPTEKLLGEIRDALRTR